ncbi:hypothetical protein [Pinirhizobacter sp.]|jgi:hypothetical protein|uniref:hypothetical protein n=1 Tax=Pinirhizobacter sp. TaxID=2950432 RepID=UPI002F41CD4C
MGVFVKFATMMALAVIATPVLSDPPGLIRAMDQAAAKHHGKATPAVSSRAVAPAADDAPGVTHRVEYANDHALDAQGHKLDVGGRPVGQAPTPTAPVTTSPSASASSGQ